MLQPANTDWARRGNSGVASSFDRPLSRTSLPLSFLRQENRIRRRSDKPQVPLGIPLSGIDQSCYFTSEVPPPDPDYDFIADTWEDADGIDSDDGPQVLGEDDDDFDLEEDFYRRHPDAPKRTDPPAAWRQPAR